MKKRVKFFVAIVMMFTLLVGCVSEQGKKDIYKALEEENMFDSDWDKIDEDKEGVANACMKDGLENLSLTVEYFKMDNGNICWVCMEEDDQDENEYNVLVGKDMTYTMGECTMYINKKSGKSKKVLVPEYIVDQSAESTIKYYHISADGEAEELEECPFDWFE